MSKYIEDASSLPVTWQKSRRSGNAGSCVEVATAGADAVFMRDSKNPTGPALAFNREEWTAWLLGAKDGEFDGI